MWRSANCTFGAHDGLLKTHSSFVRVEYSIRSKSRVPTSPNINISTVRPPAFQQRRRVETLNAQTEKIFRPQDITVQPDNHRQHHLRNGDLLVVPFLGE